MSTPPGRSAPGSLLWGVPTAVLVHNVEEALTVGRYTPAVLALVPDAVRRLMPSSQYIYVIYVALVVATAIPIAFALVARRDRRSWATYGLLLVAAVMLVNAVWHSVAAVLLGGYAPGVVTAVAINLPVMALVLRWARRESWLSKGALWMYLGIGLMLHGAGVLALLALARFS
ncbi:MAG: HXXEE domain-containing protein [Gemmatimonadota bacterium]|nr:HXXEE domain-containing protein [Gemmatimonadota bacterium]